VNKNKLAITMLTQFKQGKAWKIILLIGLLTRCQACRLQNESDSTVAQPFPIPDFLAPLELYPNVLNITEQERKRFHPVVKFPKIWIETPSGGRQRAFNYQVLDLTNRSATDELASEKERHMARTMGKAHRRKKHSGFQVGRYDENRIHLYASEVFDNTTYEIDGYSGQRTIHMGIDLDGPIYTRVYSFWKGVVHASGYNEELGDYGNVIVIRHSLDCSNHGTFRYLWALYGHLDDNSIKRLRPGSRVKRGQCIGRMGDIHENGGWRTPHAHFQLSLSPPHTHDMPGVVSMKDRPRALLEYPDPRLVLGLLY
jgi:peptidoglycan LD-endopeptidase LytH